MVVVVASVEVDGVVVGVPVWLSSFVCWKCIRQACDVLLVLCRSLVWALVVGGVVVVVVDLGCGIDDNEVVLVRMRLFFVGVVFGDEVAAAVVVALLYVSDGGVRSRLYC